MLSYIAVRSNASLCWTASLLGTYHIKVNLTSIQEDVLRFISTCLHVVQVSNSSVMSLEKVQGYLRLGRPSISQKSHHL